MSNARKIRPPNRFKTLALDGRGKTVAQALAAAAGKLGELRAVCEAEIGQRIGDIDRRFGRAAAGRAGRDLEELYQLASGIIDASAPMKVQWTSRAAHALCDVVDHCQMTGETDWEAVDVHIRALVLLHQSGEEVPEDAARHILAGLGDVFRKRFGAPQAAAQ